MASAGRADASTYCRNKCVVQRVTRGQSHIHLQVTGKYEQVSATRFSPAGIASYEASRWLIVQIARRAVEQRFYIFTAWMTRLWLIMLYLICSIQPPSVGWFNVPASRRFQVFAVALGCFFSPLSNFNYLFLNMCACAAVCKCNHGGGHAAEEVGLLWSSQLMCVSQNYICKNSLFFVLQIGMCLYVYCN